MRTTIRILESPEEMEAVEELQRIVWPGSELDIVPGHMLLAACHNGGLVLGAYTDEFRSTFEPTAAPPGSELVGFVYGFPGLYFTPDGPRPKHCSHMMGVHPQFRDRGLGFSLKRAQWQLVRQQGLDRITWTYDPLLSRNAHLNISKLGAVCNTYLREVYGEMRDGLNIGFSSDRFQVDWWVNSHRVNRRLSKQVRRPLDLADYFAGGVEVINPSNFDKDGFPKPADELRHPSNIRVEGEFIPIVLVEVPFDFQALKAAKPELASEWRTHTRALFENLFESGYLVTDFVFLPGDHPRSFYALTHGDSTL